MKIAVISDIHGNEKALRNVIHEINEKKISLIFFLGDLVGYYYHPEIAFQMLDKFKVYYLKGNHDRMLLEAIQLGKVSDTIKLKYGSGLEMALGNLSQEQITQMKQWDTRKYIEIDGLRFALCHGTLKNIDEYLYPDKDLSSYFDETYDFILMGHSHYAFAASYRNCTLLNPGSVGQARDVSGMASWCTIDTSNRAIAFYRTPYNRACVIEEVEKYDPDNKYLIDVLTR